MRKLLIAILLTGTAEISFAQSGQGDCASAAEMTGLTLSIGTVKGRGNVLEISGNALGNRDYFTEEHNTAWVAFRAPENADLSFTIAPKNAGEDWDFLLFPDDKSGCSAIAEKKIRPVRTNLARNDAKTSGITGLGFDAMNDFVPAGVNPNMSSYYTVAAGQNLILAVDINQAAISGFDLTINYRTPPAPPREETALEESPAPAAGFEFVDMTETVIPAETVKMNFEVLLEGSEKPVECDAEIVGVQWESGELKFAKTSSFTADIPKDQWFFVNVKKHGYTFGTEKIKAGAELNGTTQKLYVSKLKAGNQMVLKEIVFRENTTHLLPSSVNALDQLIAFMNDNPTARIKIKGHVNAPGLDNDGKVKKFSLKRAEQIKTYLVDAGVDSKRIEVIGLGNEQMIYRNPSNYEEEKANRRVEVEILSF